MRHTRWGRPVPRPIDCGSDQQHAESAAEEQKCRGFGDRHDRYRRNLDKSLTRRVSLHQWALEDYCDLVSG